MKIGWGKRLTRLSPHEIRRRVKSESFEKVWIESANILQKQGKKVKLEPESSASHPIFDLMQRMRKTFLEFGFKEVMLPIIVEEEEVYKQYGPEAGVILDRCYYLAALPRPDIGLGKEKCQQIMELGVPLDDKEVDALQRVLRGYKRGAISGDDLVEKVAQALKTTDLKAVRIISDVFKEFTTLKPTPLILTLRSHITSAWFETLRAVQHKQELPVKLFSVDVRFRREQSEDATHLRTHHGASCVVMDEDVTVEDGRAIAEAFLQRLGLTDVKFAQKEVTSKYYAPRTEYEGFVYAPKSMDWVEVVDLGLYSPISLANYDIECPVLNVGVGVERVGMILYAEPDIRRLVYPQFYAEWTLSDDDMTRMIRVLVEPETDMGSKIREAIVKTALSKAEEPSPCEFTAFEGEIRGRKTRVVLYENDVGTKLVGPAALNTIYVHNSNILGIPEKGMEDIQEVRETRLKGVSTGIRYLDAVASLAAKRIEDMAAEGKLQEVDIRVKMAKQPSDINVEVDEIVQHYVTSKRKRIIVKGPVFIGVRAQILE